MRRLELGASLAEVARACEVNPNVLHRWKRELHTHGVKAFAGNGKARAEEDQIAELERKVGRQAMENDFWRRCLQHAEEQRRLQALTTRGSSNPPMDARDLLRITLALMRDADLPTEEKLAVLETATTVIRDIRDSAQGEEAMRTFKSLSSQVKRA